MSILERHDKNAVAHLKMNAPERLNALSDEMLAALHAQIDSLKDDNNIKAVILSGNGKAFCAGHDIRQMTAGRAAEDKGQSYFEGLFARCTSVMLGLQHLPQPVIAQVFDQPLRMIRRSRISGNSRRLVVSLPSKVSWS